MTEKTDDNKNAFGKSALPEGLVDDFKASVKETNGKPMVSRTSYEKLMQDHYQISPDVHKSVTNAKRDMLAASAHVVADRLINDITVSNDPNNVSTELTVHTGMDKIHVRGDSQHTTRTPGTNEEHHSPRIRMTCNIPDALHRSSTEGMKDHIQKAIDNRLENL